MTAVKRYNLLVHFKKELILYPDTDMYIYVAYSCTVCGIKKKSMLTECKDLIKQSLAVLDLREEWCKSG